MWIREIDIEGFGTWARQRFQLEPDLNIILGPNEAGKSTLLHFIRSVLFGFERRGQASRYEPLSGETHGGRVLLQLDNDSYVVERIGGVSGPSSGRVTIVDSQGARFGEEMLPNLLGGVTKELFYSIFAFGLWELEQLDSLSRAEVNGIIFSAGIDTPVPIVQVEQALQKEADELFRKGASKPVINQGLLKLEELYQEIQDLANQPREYREAVRERDNLLADIETTVRQLRSLRSGLAWAYTLASAWETWQAWQKVRVELENLPAVESFPVQGEMRLEELLQRLAEQKTSLQQQEALLAEREGLLAEIQHGMILAEHRTEVLDLAERRSAFLQNMDRCKKQAGKVAECRKTVEQRLAALGNGWTQERVQAMQSGLEMKETVRSMKARLQELEEPVRSRKVRLQEAAAKVQESIEQVTNLEKKIRSLSERIHSLNPSTYDYEDRRKAFNKFRSSSEEIRTLEAQRDHLRESIAALEHQMSGLPLESLFGSRFQRQLMGLVGFGIAVLLMAALLGFLNYRSSGLALGAVGGTLAFIGLGMRVLLNGQTRQERQRLQNKRKEVETQLQERKSDYQVVVMKIEKVQGKAASAATICFGHSEPADEEIWTCQQALDEEKQLRTRLQILQDELDGAREKREKAEEERKRAETQVFEAERTMADALDQWKSWLTDHGLAANLTPDGALEVLDGVMSALDAVRKCEEEETAQSVLEEQIDAYCRRVNRLRELCGENPVSPDSAAEAVFDLKSALEEYEKLFTEVKKQRDTVSALREQLQATEGALAHLLQQAGAEDAEDFRRLAAIYMERQKLQRDLRELEVELSSRGAERGFEAICHDLEQTNAEMLEERIKALREQEAELEEMVAQQRTRVGELNQKIASLEQDQRRSSLHFAYDTLQGEMNEASRRWAKLVMAKELVAMTRQRYEKTRQPEVLREASSFFFQMTAGRYQRVFAPLGEQVIRVETADRRYLTVEQLSRGTVEQLYLAMRFALIQEFARRSVILPVIMDDILVDFDPVRLDRTAAVIREMARKHQVLFFSCHPHVAAALLGSGQQGKLIEL